MLGLPAPPPLTRAPLYFCIPHVASLRTRSGPPDRPGPQRTRCQGGVVAAPLVRLPPAAACLDLSIVLLLWVPGNSRPAQLRRGTDGARCVCFPFAEEGGGRGHADVQRASRCVDQGGLDLGKEPGPGELRRAGGYGSSTRCATRVVTNSTFPAQNTKFFGLQILEQTVKYKW